MNDTKIVVELHADKYGQGNVQSILDKRFGFELSFENDYVRDLRILTLDQVISLKDSIEQSLKSYELAIKD